MSAENRPDPSEDVWENDPVFQEEIARSRAEYLARSPAMARRLAEERAPGLSARTRGILLISAFVLVAFLIGLATSYFRA